MLSFVPGRLLFSLSFSMAGLVKWGIKLGAVGGAVYLAASERFFGSTEETADSYGRLKGWMAVGLVGRLRSFDSSQRLYIVRRLVDFTRVDLTVKKIRVD